MAAYFSEEYIQQRYEDMQKHIIGQWRSMGSIRGKYYLQCSCLRDCFCTDWEEMPRISLYKCLYPGELDNFFVKQPFAQYGLRVQWHCEECWSEMSCGFPPIGTE